MWITFFADLLNFTAAAVTLVPQLSFAFSFKVAVISLVEIMRIVYTATIRSAESDTI